MQCGAACLAMIAAYHGRAISLREAENLCGGSKRGVSLYGLSEAAQRIGMRTTAGRLTIGQLRQVTKPCVAHWDGNHFVVVTRINRNKVTLCDPGRGKRTIAIDEFLRHWLSVSVGGEERGVALTMVPGGSFERGGKVESGSRSGFSRIFRYISRYKICMAEVLGILVIGCLLQLVMPFLTQAIVDIGIRKTDIGFIWLILVGEFAIVAGRTVTDFLRRWLLLHVSMRVNISLTGDFLVKLLKMPMRFFDVKLLGDILQRMGDHTRVQNFLTGETLNILFTLISLLIFGTVLLIYDVYVFLAFLAFSAVYLVWISVFLRQRRQMDYELFSLQGVNQDVTYEFISSMQEIKLQDCRQRRRWEWEDTQADLFVVQMKSLKLQQAQEGGSIFINELKNIVVTILSAQAVISGYMSLGAMLAVQYIIGQLNSPLSSLMSFIYSLQDVRISLERINEIHDCRDEDAEDAEKRGVPDAGDVTLDAVDFKYDNNSARKVLDGVTMRIERGKVNAVVGASGSGKTTLIKLLLGYYPTLKGEIRIGGRPLEEIRLSEWRRKCGVVMQEGVIFSDSIARNIAVSDGDIDMERLVYAARMANIYDYIMGLPLRFDTMVGRRGNGLSQGQKQRILIARAIYRNPDFIFLDEATNSLDARNEREIVDNLEEYFKGRTVLVVAHRLSTVRYADVINVMDHGKIVERGCHEELVRKRGLYWQLVKNQLELGT